MKKIAKAIAILLTFALLAGCADGGDTTTTATTPHSTLPATTPATTTPPTPTLEDYFPLTPNVHRVYEGEGNEYAGYETHVDYVRDGVIQFRRNNGGTEMVGVYVFEDDAVKWVFVRPETYYRYDFIGPRNYDEILLKEPLEVGNSWTLPDGHTRTITDLAAPVTTPYGTFEALEVTTAFENAEEKSWYAPGVGLVMTEYRAAEEGFTVSSRLKTVETVPLTQNIRVFFPISAEDRLVYRDVPITFETNEDLTTRLPELLESIPEDSGLPVKAPDTPIFRGLALDADAGTVTIDLSRDFLTWINAGSSLEAQILQSITNTLGVYYDVDRVIITLDGKPYESGHFSMDEGQAFVVNTEGIEEYQ